MPWQQYVADVAGELLPDGTPAFREAIVTVPRQQGKTTWLLCEKVERCTARPTPHRVAYTAQSGQDARKKILDDEVPVIRASGLWPAVARVNRAQGNEGIVWVNGSRVDVLASTVSAGHGKIVDLGIIDEAFDDLDDRREQAILPAMVTRPRAQLYVVSTMGTDASVYLNRKIDMGRAAALEGRTTGVAYFEWSIPLEVDIADEASWWLGMPALGNTVGLEAVRHARQTMTDSEFRRAFGNQRTKTAERAISDTGWLAVQRTEATPGDPLMFGVDVSPDRDWSAVVSAGMWQDRPAVELVDYRPGTAWLATRCAELCGKHGGRVVLDTRGPAGSLIPAFDQAGVPMLDPQPSATEVVQACGAFHDAVADHQLWVRPDGRLDAAIVAAMKQPVGDSWRWGRKGTGDATPLMAATLAVWAIRGRNAVQFFVY